MILVTGSLAFDHLFNFPGTFSDHILADKIHQLNVSFMVSDMRKSFGGCAGNIAYTLSLLGIKAAILGLVGEDFGSYQKFLEKNEIETKYITRINNILSSTAFGITDKNDNNIWGFYPGADKLSDNLTVLSVKEKIDFGIIAPQKPTSMLKFADEYYRSGIPFIFDPGMQLPWLTGDDLNRAFKKANIIIGNDYEVSLMEKKTGIKNLNSLAQNGKMIITTLGDQGSRICFKSEVINVRAAKARNVDDPAGAGDAYRAGFVAGYMRKFSLLTCGQMGSLAASYSVEKYGTTTHHFTASEFCRRYKESFSEEIKI
ncbi:hypothetical protein A2960_02695 [Candidatus Gottesmanbacteria bacterium RIFCSPLOWO2_01_FULL_39_12b]|uniref:Carbohydrate kinase PfkB domain-containing protein n=1 Tax=Candidatus Gottesmanbacteria bacterium RIFCSPLOWO2_01_FULL_39_12b TaxID=1798388 RepID=A0A1F6AQR4_9BACT|nr:MAG: hypothetical protein A2960_02695 [Candidatus Gottesmanbacteria bacterium RIFCSPLOWO2_01_FULL_39_12b]